jgi:beta-glucanase (GH16 family)
MPGDDVPGYARVFADDFRYSVPLGRFPAAVQREWGKSYPDGTPDTSGHGRYEPTDVVSIGCGLMHIDMHTANGVHEVAAVVPTIPGATGPEGGLNAGMYEIRFRATVATDAYKVAFLLWPDSERWPADGEIDFPEGGLGTTIGAYMHHQGGTSQDDQDLYATNATFTTWHTATIVWRPDLGFTSFSLDGNLVGRSTAAVPDTPMHWVLQCETAETGPAPPDDVATEVQVAWVAAFVPH